MLPQEPESAVTDVDFLNGGIVCDDRVTGYGIGHELAKTGKYPFIAEMLSDIPVVPVPLR